MKRIFADIGEFYTRVVVFEKTRDGDRYFGRTFFPTVTEEVAATGGRKLYYGYQGRFYTVGKDCERIALAWVVKADRGREDGILLTKILYDFADGTDEIELNLLFDTPERLAELKGALNGKETSEAGVLARRGADRKDIRKTVSLKVTYVSAVDSIDGFLKKNLGEGRSSLVVDMGHNTTKAYLVSGSQGVVRRVVIRSGVRCYYERILRLLPEQGVRDVHCFWLVKQFESACDAIELLGLGDTVARYVDVSAIRNDVRWEQNKELCTRISDMMVSYYTNELQWPESLVVTGGGAALGGELLHRSLGERGISFKKVHIEENAMYAGVEGMAFHFLQKERAQKMM